jgi:hypothetical protein
VLDGTLIPIDRVAADRPFYSGKHRKHGMNLQVIASPDRDIVWVSGPLPGAVHDLTAARIWGIVQALAASGLGGASWFGGNTTAGGAQNFTDTEHFQILGPSGGPVGSVSIVAHATVNANGTLTISFERDTGTCQPPQD